MSFPGFPGIIPGALATAMRSFRKDGANRWCLCHGLGAPEQSPDVLKAEPWDGAVCLFPRRHCAHPVLVLTNKSASLGEELGRAGRCSYVVGTPKIQFEVPAPLLGSGLGFGPSVWVSFRATQEPKASSERQSGKLVVRLFFFLFFLLKPFNYSHFL